MSKYQEALNEIAIALAVRGCTGHMNQFDILQELIDSYDDISKMVQHFKNLYISREKALDKACERLVYVNDSGILPEYSKDQWKDYLLSEVSK